MFKGVRYLLNIIKLSNKKFNDMNEAKNNLLLQQQALLAQSKALYALRVQTNTVLHMLSESNGKLKYAVVGISRDCSPHIKEVEDTLECSFTLLEQQSEMNIYTLCSCEEEF